MFLFSPFPLGRGQGDGPESRAVRETTRNNRRFVHTCGMTTGAVG